MNAVGTRFAIRIPTSGGWGGRISNLRMADPKSAALPLGDAPNARPTLGCAVAGGNLGRGSDRVVRQAATHHPGRVSAMRCAAAAAAATGFETADTGRAATRHAAEQAARLRIEHGQDLGHRRHHLPCRAPPDRCGSSAARLLSVQWGRRFGPRPECLRPQSLENGGRSQWRRGLTSTRRPARRARSAAAAARRYPASARPAVQADRDVRTQSQGRAPRDRISKGSYPTGVAGHAAPLRRRPSRRRSRPPPATACPA